jgi:hypothetical protein
VSSNIPQILNRGRARPLLWLASDIERMAQL